MPKVSPLIQKNPLNQNMCVQIGQMVEGAKVRSLHTNETFGVLEVRYFVKRQNVVFSFFQTQLALSSSTEFWMQMGRGKHVRNQKINSKRQGSGGCGKLPRWNRERAIRSSVCPSVPEGCQEARLTENIGNACPPGRGWAEERPTSGRFFIAFTAPSDPSQLHILRCEWRLPRLPPPRFRSSSSSAV